MKRWSARGGYKEALNIGFPLVVSMTSTTVMQFTDRVFLSGYSLDALSASLPAGILSFLFLSFFMGCIEYSNVYVAQYTGAARPHRVGSVLWQGLWLCVPSAAILAGLGLCGDFFFGLAGHPEAIRGLENTYFRILCFGSGIVLVSICLSCFYSGRGLTKAVMVVNTLAALVNIPLNYALINGYYGFPEMGIAGAALATVIAWVVMLVTYVLLMFRRENEEMYKIRSGWKMDLDLMRRLVVYGLPSGVQFFLDMFAITFFVLMAGRIGEIELAATNAAITIYTLSFLPAVGMCIAASIMVGQSMGRRDPERAAYAVHTVLHMCLLYMGLTAVAYVAFPEALMNLFQPRGMSSEEFEPVMHMGVVLLRYAAAFTLFDAIAITYAGGIKGAGDTRFVMYLLAVVSIGCMVLPMVVLNYFNLLGIHILWILLLVYVTILAASLYGRFRSGIWMGHTLVREED